VSELIFIPVAHILTPRVQGSVTPLPCVLGFADFFAILGIEHELADIAIELGFPEEFGTTLYVAVPTMGFGTGVSQTTPATSHTVLGLCGKRLHGGCAGKHIKIGIGHEVGYRPCDQKARCLQNEILDNLPASLDLVKSHGKQQQIANGMSKRKNFSPGLALIHIKT